MDSNEFVAITDQIMIDLGDCFEFDDDWFIRLLNVNFQERSRK